MKKFTIVHKRHRRDELPQTVPYELAYLVMRLASR